MSDSNETRYRAFFKAINEGNFDAAAEFLNENIVDHNKPPGVPDGREGFLAQMAMWTASFSDIRLEVVKLVANGDLLAAHLAVSCKHTGEFMGTPATGKDIQVNGTEIVRFADDGTMAERWGTDDMFSLLIQIGAVPAPEM